MYDLIIIGAGPAGITASIYAVRKGLNILVVTKDMGGGNSVLDAALRVFRYLDQSR